MMYKFSSFLTHTYTHTHRRIYDNVCSCHSARVKKHYCNDLIDVTDKHNRRLSLSVRSRSAMTYNRKACLTCVYLIGILEEHKS